MTITNFTIICLKNVDVLDDIVDNYNNAFHRIIGMKPTDVKPDSKFKVGDHVKISKYKNIFAKGYTLNCPEEVFVISKIKNTVPWAYVISGLNKSKRILNRKDN